MVSSISMPYHTTPADASIQRLDIYRTLSGNLACPDQRRIIMDLHTPDETSRIMIRMNLRCTGWAEYIYTIELMIFIWRSWAVICRSRLGLYYVYLSCDKPILSLVRVKGVKANISIQTLARVKWRPRSKASLLLDEMFRKGAMGLTLSAMTETSRGWVVAWL